MPHPTRPVAYGGWQADVDEAVAALVLALWRAGIETASACQDEGESILEVGAPGSAWVEHEAASHRGRAYVDLLSPDDVARLFGLVANGGPRDALYERMVHTASPSAWEVRLTMFDTLPATTGDWSMPSHFAAGVVRVRLPRGDVAAVVERLVVAASGVPVPHAEPAWDTLGG